MIDQIVIKDCNFEQKFTATQIRNFAICKAIADLVEKKHKGTNR